MKFLEVQDLPRDRLQALSSVRKPLILTYNYCRNFPVKMQLFKETLQAVVKQIEAWEKEQRPVQPKQAKTKSRKETK